MMIDPSVLGRKPTRSRGLVVRRVALALLGFSALGTAVLVRDLEHGSSMYEPRQSAAIGSHEGPVWSDKVTVVAADRIGG